MKWLIDTSKTMLLYANHEPVVDFDTKAEVRDKDTGHPVFRVNLMRFDTTGRPEAVAVKVAGEPTGLNPGEAVRCEGLSVQFWEVGGKAGISFRAESVVSAVAPRMKGAA